MKPVIRGGWILIALASCGDSEITPSKPNQVVTVDKPTVSLLFMAIPTASDQLTISFYNDQERDLKSLTLMEGDIKLATVDFNSDPLVSSVFSAVVKYSFDIDKSYNFNIETVDLRDTAFLYHLKGYKHSFVNTFNYQKIADWTQLHEFDLDPSRKFLFVTDYDNNQSIIKKISLEQNTIETFPNSFPFSPIRAVSDNEIISCSRVNNNRFLSGDSVALLRQNLSSGTTQLLDYMADYKRLSRVVNGHIMFTNPMYTSKTSTIYNTTDETKIIFSNGDVEPSYLRYENFDNLYYGDNIFDWSSATFVEQIRIPEDGYILYVDNIGQYSFVIQQFMGLNNLSIQSRLLVYKGTELLHRGNLEQNCNLTLGSIIRIVDDKIIFFKEYAFSHEVRLNGYYSLDLLTGETTLVHNDSEDLAKYDFAITDNTILSVRTKGLYKITIN